MVESTINNWRYTLYILGPAADRYPDLLGNKLEGAIRRLGLEPKDDFQFVYGGDPHAIDDRDWPVGVWFGDEAGSADPEHLKVLERLQALGCPVLPLVATLEKFTACVPDPLRPINGMRWDDPEVPNDVLRGFRLTRNLRQAFISYRRIDSQGVADALFEHLTHRRYQTFLDTASVESMEPFQNVLWDRLADMDLLILLDTKNALSSQYVSDELVQVNQLGLGVLQLVWPGHTPSRETELSTRCQLEAGDFIDNDYGPTGRLEEQALQKIAAQAENVRIESLAARRRRVVGEFLARSGHAPRGCAGGRPTGAPAGRHGHRRRAGGNRLPDRRFARCSIHAYRAHGY